MIQAEDFHAGARAFHESGFPKGWSWGEMSTDLGGVEENAMVHACTSHRN